MTFEEFFLKKKIDLDFFKQGKPDVFAEFVAHYKVMSEKSFDHTKKYWFNNLRIDYLLSEEKEATLKEVFKPKVESVTVENIVTEKPAEVLPTIVKAPAFKPRFKVAATTNVSSENEEVVETALLKSADSEIDSPTPKSAGFKPRFKVGVTPSTLKVEEENPDVLKEELQSVEKTVVAKPAGFKPRFKAGVTVSTPLPKVEEEKVETVKEEIQSEEKPVVAKPAGFKPRFKVTKKED